ncbi:MAG TPA: hypothetical protein VKE69_05810, partial [Planctomycetota bacterium]|nr:hypothetical protein [Planctomycetota bacterium]
ATTVLSFDARSGPVGDGFAPLPIPSLPPLVGLTFYAQTLWVEQVGWITSPAVLGLVSSKGLSITFQP